MNPANENVELIVQGTFRSGTTILFDCLRRDPGRCSYYEPLHPELPGLVRAAGERRGPKHELFTEYLGPGAPALEYFRTDLAYRHACLTAEADAPPLAAYLDALAASGSRVFLQFNRAFWIAPWLARRYPRARFVHLVRDPRSVVWSQLRRHPEHRSVALDGAREDRLPEALFSPLADVSYYYADRYARLARERRVDGVGSLRPGHLPVEEALAVWKAQVGVCHEQASVAFGPRYRLLRYEDFASNPIEALTTLYDDVARLLPRPVADFAEVRVHPPSSRPWEDDQRLAARLSEACRRAGLLPVAAELGYDVERLRA